MFHIVCYHNFLQPLFPHTCLLNIQVIILKLKSRAGHSVCMNQVRVVDLIYTHTRGTLCAWNWISLILIFFIVIVASTTDVITSIDVSAQLAKHLRIILKAQLKKWGRMHWKLVSIAIPAVTSPCCCKIDGFNSSCKPLDPIMYLTSAIRFKTISFYLLSIATLQLSAWSTCKHRVFSS